MLLYYTHCCCWQMQVWTWICPKLSELTAMILYHERGWNYSNYVQVADVLYNTGHLWCKFAKNIEQQATVVSPSFIYTIVTPKREYSRAPVRSDRAQGLLGHFKSPRRLGSRAARLASKDFDRSAKLQICNGWHLLHVKPLWQAQLCITQTELLPEPVKRGRKKQHLKLLFALSLRKSCHWIDVCEALLQRVPLFSSLQLPPGFATITHWSKLPSPE